ncbi:MAG TPA: methyl-accepting chemotaxis protein [Acetivibrio sp.]|nr:methyl-accepting chemotaxis protein [Acetivibrio sp.]
MKARFPFKNYISKINLKNTSISIKLNVIISLIMILSLSVSIIYSFNVVLGILIEQVKEATVQVTRQTTLNMQLKLEELDQLAQDLSRNDEIAGLVTNLNNAEDELVKVGYDSKIKTILTDYANRNGEKINAVLLVSNNYSNSMSGQQGVKTTVDISKVESIKSFFDSKENSRWYDPYMQDLDILQDSTGMGGYVVTLAKGIFSSTSLKSQGKLFFYLNYNNLAKVLQNVNMSYDGRIYIIGNNGNIIVNPKERGHFGMDVNSVSQEDKERLLYIDEDMFKRIKSEKDGAFTGELYGKEVLVTYSTIDVINGTMLGWTVVTVTEVDKITENVSNVAFQAIIIGIICLILGILFTWIINRDITKNIKILVNRMEEVSKGNLSIDYIADERKDEIGKLSRGFARMMKSLNSLLISIKSASDITVDASSNVSAKIQQTYASIQETNAILETVRDKSRQQGIIVKDGREKILSTQNEINKAKDTMKNVDNVISKSKDISEDNKNAVGLLNEMSRNVNTAMIEISQRTKDLITTSTEITRFTKKIKEISEQTKLIALNSAIESAKLGAEGRSFHLLSEEARTLAAKTKELSGNIEYIIQNLINKIYDTHQDVIKLREVVENGEDSVQNITDSFDKNIAFLNEVTRHVSDIQHVFLSIDSFVQDIVTTIEYISTSSESNLQDISDVSVAMSEQMKSQESLLEETVNLLNLSQELKKKAQEIN